MNLAPDPSQRRRASPPLPGSKDGEELPGKRRLPDDYSPDDTAIICGRGKACTASAGNRRLKNIVKAHIEQYSRATHKTDKTKTVNSILDTVRGIHNDQGMFVRKHDDGWWEVEDTIAREKVGCMIRDILHTQYRSSSKAKFEKKKRRKSLSDLDQAKAIYNEADLLPPRGISLPGCIPSPTIPSLIASRLFTLSSSSGLSSFTASEQRSVPQSIDYQDRQIIHAQQSALMGSLQRMPSGLTIPTESLHHLRSIDQHERGQGTSDFKRRAHFGKFSSTGVSENDDSSPDSTGWGLGRNLEHVQRAQAVVASDSGATSQAAEEALPDDLSGIFDD